MDTTGHRWVGALASFKFALEYQKWADNGATDALSQVPICHNRETVCSLLEGTVIGTVEWSEVEANEELLCEHVHLEDEVRVQAAKLVPMHEVDWGEAQETDVVLATCRKWLKAHKDTPPKKRDALLKKYLGNQVDMEEGCTLFHVHNSLVLNKGTVVYQYNAQGGGRGGVGLLGSFQSVHSGFEWCSPRCRPPGPAKNAGSGTRTFLVANDGRRLQGPIKGLPEVLCI